jgi:macrolide transport system ATP-binding/permease protein
MMDAVSHIFRKLGMLLRRGRFQDELDEEMAFHRDEAARAFEAEGMSREEARYAALRQFGNAARLKDESRETVGFKWESVMQDLRFALRQLGKYPGFALTAILTLSLGICASVAIFAFVDAVLVNPLPYKNPSHLVNLFESTSLGPRFHLSYLDYLDWKKLNQVFSSVEAYDNNPVALNTAAGAQQVDGAIVSAGFFRTLGVAPLFGRDFRPGEDKTGAPHTVMLSFAAWQNRYGRRHDVIGQTVTLDGAPNVIIGVLPPEFYFAPAGPAEFWTTLQMSSNPDDRGEHGLSAIARLKDGVSLKTASADISSIAQQLAKQYPDSDEGRGATVVPLAEVINGNVRPILLLLLSGAVLLLLIACVNVSGLLLVRSENRRREMAVRGALGASYLRLIRQFAIEGLTLVAAGSFIGLIAAYEAIHLLTLLIPANMRVDMPYLRGLGLNLHVLCFAGIIGLMATLLLSCMPVFRLSLSNLRAGLTEGGRGAAGTVWRHLGANLVVIELCTAMVLLVGAGLLGKSLYKLLQVDIGMHPDHLAVLRLRVPRARYPKAEQTVALTHRVMDEMGRLPGVKSAAVAHQIPVANVAGGNTTFQIIGRPQQKEGNEANSRQVGAGYFHTVQARLLRGRYFSEEDNASKPRVMIINESFARKYFAGEDPIGKQIRYDQSEPAIAIIGIIDDIKEGPLDADVQPALYTPFDQEPDNTFFVVVRTARAPGAFLKTLEKTALQIDPNILVFRAETMEDRINDSQTAYLHRFSALLVGGFAALALLLGVVGLYGVIAYSVSQRTREIGVRMALGAQRSAVYGMILREAGWLTVIGIAAGVVGSIGAGLLMRSLLFGVKSWDVSTLFAVAVVLAGASAIASYLPARRAASVNPVEALRAE